MPVGAALAAVKVLGLDDLVDGFTLTNGVKRSDLESAQAVDLRPGQAADGDGGAAIASDGILKRQQIGSLQIL